MLPPQHICRCESKALRPQHSALSGRGCLTPSQHINLGFTGMIPLPQHSTHGNNAKKSLPGCWGMSAATSCWYKICLMLSIVSLQHFSILVLYALSPQQSALSGLGWIYSRHKATTICFYHHQTFQIKDNAVSLG